MKCGSLGRKSSNKREMLHKQAKNYLFIKKVQKYLHAKSDLYWTMKGVNLPTPVTLKGAQQGSEHVKLRRFKLGKN